MIARRDDKDSNARTAMTLDESPRAAVRCPPSADSRVSGSSRLYDLRVVEVVEQVTDEVVEAMARLVRQLSASAPPVQRHDVEAVVASDSTRLLVARNADGTSIVGSLTLVIFSIPTGIRALIEDVIVDQEARGLGIGTLLMQEAVKLARQAGARTVDLTSRPSREAANALYQREGFVQRETNVYRYTL
jgi:ribosomal protein S18 acetylase RimI-like enzyme